MTKRSRSSTKADFVAHGSSSEVLFFISSLSIAQFSHDSVFNGSIIRLALMVGKKHHRWLTFQEDLWNHRGPFCPAGIYQVESDEESILYTNDRRSAHLIK